MTRLNPFDHAFAALARVRFSGIRDEAAASRTDAGDRAQFTALPSVQRLLGEIESPDLLASHPEAAEEYTTVLFVAYRYWDAGCPLLPVTRRQVEEAMNATDVDARREVPHGACYLQFPERWFWACVEPATPHEPLDGIFVVAAAQDRERAVLAVLGLREERGGFSQIAVVTTPDDMRIACRFTRSPPFDPVLDGGPQAGLKSLVSTAELLYLAQLALPPAAR